MNHPLSPSAGTPLDRRHWLRRCGAGAGMLGLAGLLRDEGLLAAEPFKYDNIIILAGSDDTGHRP